MKAHLDNHEFPVQRPDIGRLREGMGAHTAAGWIEHLEARLADDHVHCDGDPIECGVQAMQGELAEVRYERDLLHRRVQDLEAATRGEIRVTYGAADGNRVTVVDPLL